MGRYDDAQFVMQSLPGYNPVALEEDLIDAYASSPGLINSTIQEVEEPEAESEESDVDAEKFIKGVAARTYLGSSLQKNPGTTRATTQKTWSACPSQIDSACT
ncbi:MAG: hypothetical protein IPL73_03275 [Candidatus Obscuribacter sp.]|nr:hypothetical protein [Candidatus Obscuribacter sp.]